MKSIPAFGLALLGLVSSLNAGTGARVYCWAPHLSAPILLDSHGQGIGSYAGRTDTKSTESPGYSRWVTSATALSRIRTIHKNVSARDGGSEDWVTARTSTPR